MPDKPRPIAAPCSQRYSAFHHSGTRKLDDITLVVMHDTEGGTAQSIAQYFESPSSGGSAHLVVDDVNCFRVLDNKDIPWGAPGANSQGFHIEQVGYAKWSAVLWGKHRMTLKRAAFKAAYHAVKFGIPPVFIGAAGIRAGKRGITTHAEVTKAFPNLGTHTDPGPLWPRRLFMRYVRQFYADISGL